MDRNTHAGVREKTFERFDIQRTGDNRWDNGHGNLAIDIRHDRTSIQYANAQASRDWG